MKNKDPLDERQLLHIEKLVRKGNTRIQRGNDSRCEDNR
jgi:hypothetical protein